LLAVSRGVSSLARISYVRQKEPLGLGHAVLCAKDLVGDEPFAVILPDDVIDAEVPCLKQMIDVFDEKGGSVLATQTVEGPGISAYGVLAGSQDPENWRIYQLHRHGGEAEV
jgi:UTP--glucose-1-phosphate uridylyltransferase